MKFYEKVIILSFILGLGILNNKVTEKSNQVFSKFEKKFKKSEINSNYAENLNKDVNYSEVKLK